MGYPSMKWTSGKEITLRDYFAAAALTGLLANPDLGNSDSEILAKLAYEQADEMIAERSKE